MNLRAYQRVMATSDIPDSPINRIGLTQIYTPRGDERKFVDVVFVHGLNGHPEATWTSEKSKVFWPVQLLPPVIQEDNTRIMVYGYDADVTSLIDGGSKDKIHIHAEQLVAELCANRRRHEALERPIIFVAHSLGGLVVKRALIYSSEILGNHTEHLRSIYVSTYGILFLGTPHKGFETVEWGFFLESACSGIDTQHQLINALKNNSETLQIADRQFIQLVSRYRIYFFHEAKPTNLRGSLKYIVSEESASPSIQDVDRASIEQDHFHMSKFEDDRAPGFQIVTEGIDRYARKASEIIISRWEWERREQQNKRRAVVEEIIPGTFRHSDNNTLSGSTLSDSSRVLKPLFLVPFGQDILFVNRPEIFDGIDQHMRQQRRFALSGIGGVGKSQIAIEYCYRFRKNHPHAHIVWVHASTRQRFGQAYRNIAQKLEIPGWNDPKIDTLHLVLEWFNEVDNGSWLIVLDSADDLEIFFKKPTSNATDSECTSPLKDYLPQNPNGSILLTTRDERLAQRLAGRHASIIVDRMSPQEAQDLLRNRQVELPKHSDLDDTRNLLEALEYLPLAISQAAAFISENHITLSKYLATLRANDFDLQELLNEDLGDLRRDKESENSVVKTWKISFDLISEREPRAAEMLSLMAVLDRQSIPESLLRKPSDQNVGFMKALGTLLAFSLIKAGRDGSRYEMHRMVQLATQNWLQTQDQIGMWQEKALSMVADNFQHDDEGWPQNLTVWGVLLPQAQTVIQYGEELGICTEKYAKLLRIVAYFDWMYGRDEMSVKRSIAAYEVRKRLYGTHHPLTLNALSEVAQAYVYVGLWERAEELQEDVLKDQGRLLGVEHPDTLDSISQLASIYERRERWKEAEKLRVQVRETSERVYGAEHSLTLVAMLRLGVNLKGQNRCREAIVILERVVDSQTKIDGVDSLHTLSSMVHLAGAYCDQGHHREAADIMERVVNSHTKFGGSVPLLTVQHMQMLAVVYYQQGRRSEAIALLARVLESETKFLGANHPRITEIARMLTDFRNGRFVSQAGTRNEQGGTFWQLLKHVSQSFLDRFWGIRNHDGL